ncbi:hypothetical protein ACFVIN_17810 [Streptomyces prasinus]|uniref:hypothetical protein n=1 Tax=Streptomyces prasinus TaxID=67345 RepID=UPI003628E176
MDAGIAAIVGAAVGVAGTTLAAAVAGMSAQRQVRAEHRHWRRQLRRDAYSAFTAKADEVFRILKEIDAELIKPTADFDFLRAHVVQARAALHNELADVQATVEIEGPEKLARMAGDLFRSLSACIANVHSVTLGQDPGALAAVSEAQSRRIRRFLNHAASKRSQFVEHARNTIDV